jgi:flagellar biosynthesis GTPase FlhF
MVKMKRIFFGAIVFLSVSHIAGQGADTYFHSGAQYFINGKNDLALLEVNNGLARFPDDPKLLALAEKLREQQEKQQKEQQQNQQNQRKDQQQQKKDQQQQEQQDKQQQQQNEKRKQEQQQAQKKEAEEQQGQQGKKSEDQEARKMSKTAAMQILKALEEKEKKGERKLRPIQGKGIQRDKDW